jgi:hypothetical protein
MTTAPVREIDFYRAIEATAQHMLQAAKASNWAELGKLEGCCKSLINQLTDFQLQAPAHLKLAGTEVRERMSIMLSLVRLDGQVRHYTEPSWRMANQALKFAAARPDIVH